MRALVILAVVFLAVVAFVVPAYCVETQPVKAAAKGTVTKITPVGEVVEISVKDASAKEVVYKLYKETKVTKGGKVVAVKDILEKDTVMVTKKGDVIETVDIEVIPETIPVTTKTGTPITTRSGAPVTAKPVSETKPAAK